MKTKNVMMAMVMLVALLLAAAGVQAGTAVDWATGGAFIKNLGNTHHTAFSIFPPESNRWNQEDTECDKVTLDIASGSLDLTTGVPQTVVINPLTFEVGWTGDMLEEDTKTNVYYLSRDITVNGVTKTLVNPVTHGVTWAADSLMVQAGEPVTFGNIVVTPLGWDPDAFFAENYGVFTQTEPSWHTISPVYAEFSLIEAPSASVILVPEKLNVPQGSTVGVSVDMTLLSPITLAAISTNILFDTSVFTYDASPALAKGSLLTHDWDLYGNEFAAGHARVGGIDMNMDPWYESLAAGTGRLFTFTLKVKNDAPLGPSPLSWGVYDGSDNATAGFDYGDAGFNDVILPESALTGASINVMAASAIWDVATVHGQNQFTISGSDSSMLHYNPQGWTDYVWYQNNGSAPGTIATTTAGPHAPAVEARSGMRTFAATDVAVGQKLRDLKLEFEYHNTLGGYPTINFFVTDGLGHFGIFAPTSSGIGAVGVIDPINGWSRMTIDLTRPDISTTAIMAIYEHNGLSTVYGDPYTGFQWNDIKDLTIAGWYDYQRSPTGGWDTWGTSFDENHGVALIWGDTANSSNAYGSQEREIRNVNVSFGGTTYIGTFKNATSVPTAITLASFEAKPGSNSVTLAWTTETEIDNAGFNILRAEAENGPYVKINTAVIPAMAGAAQGAVYQFIDTTAKNRTTYYYKLQDIGLDGSITDHGPVSAMPRFVFGFGK
jgi:hypothetical protein